MEDVPDEGQIVGGALVQKKDIGGQDRMTQVGGNYDMTKVNINII